MKLLVPTDFSELSNVALQYAIDFAGMTGASIHLHHNAIYEGPPSAGMLIDLSSKIVQQAEFELNGFAKKTRESCNHEIDISWEVTSYHNHTNAIHKVADSSGASLIIMGSKGKSGIQGALVGQVAYQTLLEASCPTLVIPPSCVFVHPGKALFSVDVNKQPDQESLSALGRIMKPINYSLNLLFVNTDSDNEKVYTIRDSVAATCPDVNLDVFTQVNGNVVDAIERFIDEHDSNMLILYPGHHNVFSELLGRSITQKLLSNFKVPVLSITC
jgi:nucleotide-binding universal stress UspA family protein